MMYQYRRRLPETAAHAAQQAVQTAGQQTGRSSRQHKQWHPRMVFASHSSIPVPGRRLIDDESRQ